MGTKTNNGTFFTKDSNGNWVPICKAADIPNITLPEDVTFTGGVMITEEITLSDEEAAQMRQRFNGGQ